MIRIRLTEDDRVKLELPEWVEFDPDRPKLSEIRRLKAEVEWELSKLWERLNHADVDERIAGRSVLVWLAVNRVRSVKWDEFDFDVLGAEIEEVGDDPNLSAPDGATTS